MPKSKPFFPAVLAGAALLSGGCARPSVSSFDRIPARAGAECPRGDLGEVPSDCPWAAWVRDVESGRTPARELPEVIAQSLLLDSADSALREAWGQSLNLDAGARAPIVERTILEELARRFGVALETREGRTVQHAGLIHTYGYLLSNLKTPFGYKRARWVSAPTEVGLGLPAGTLGPEIRGTTTLLSRATYLLFRIATHAQPKAWAEWAPRLEARATPELRALKLPQIRTNTETYGLKGGETVQLVTHLAALPGDTARGSLLVYSVVRAGRVSLITGFPVDSKFSERPGNPVRPRYNAWVE